MLYDGLALGVLTGDFHFDKSLAAIVYHSHVPITVLAQ